MKRFSDNKKVPDVPVPEPTEDMLDEFSERFILKSKKIDILLKKKKLFMKKGYELADFKEPVLYLIRRDKSVEFYEDVKPGDYKIRHSDRNLDDIKITLPESYLLRFPYGPKQYRGFIHHEDEFLPYPHKILLSGEIIRILIDKTLNDVKKWKAEELRARGDLWLKLGMGVGVIIAAYALFRLLVPDATIVPVVDNTVDKVVNVSSDIVKNVTVIIRNNTGG